jgi:hypothetical protein
VVASVPTAATREQDVAGLRAIRVAAILALVGSILGLVSSGLTNRLAGTGSLPYVAPLGLSAFRGNLGFFAALGALSAVGLILTAIEFGYYRSGFATLRPVDSRFASTPSFALLALIGLILVVVWLLVLVGTVGVCAGTGSTVRGACFGPIVGAAAVVVAGAIAFIVGAIGVLVGIWRLGVRYNDSLFKVAAVLFIFPFLGLIAAILMIVATSSIEEKLGRTPPAWGVAPSAPPPLPMAPPTPPP